MLEDDSGEERRSARCVAFSLMGGHGGYFGFNFDVSSQIGLTD